MVLEIEDLSAGYLVSDNYTFTFWVRTSAQLLMHGINSFVQGAVLKSGFEYDSYVQSGHGSGEGRRHRLLNEICSERGNNGDGDLCHDKGFEGHNSCFECLEVCDSFEVNQKSLSRRA
ncbi:hypothetical protein AAG906_003371 [Vitis piasezkii]